jgi:hypothetical protein
VKSGAKQNLHASSHLILHNKHEVQEVQLGWGAPGKAQTLTSQSFEFQT